MQMLDAKLGKSFAEKPCLKAFLLDCFCGIIGCVYNRYALRTALEIHDTIVLDCAFWWCIPCCAVTQEYMQTLERKTNLDKKTPIWEAYKAPSK